MPVITQFLGFRYHSLLFYGWLELVSSLVKLGQTGALCNTAMNQVPLPWNNTLKHSEVWMKYDSPDPKFTSSKGFS